MAKLTFSSFLYTQYGSIPALPPMVLTGKTVVVIGANTGLGFEAAQHFARMNPGKLILGCRDMKKGEAAIHRIEAETGCHTIELWEIDLCNFASVRAFASKVEKMGERLDILVENASTAPSSSHIDKTQDGWESTFQVNYLSLALLGILLLPTMIQTRDSHGVLPRLVVVTSILHMTAKLDVGLIQGGEFLKTYGSVEYASESLTNGTSKRYNDTKLLQMFLIRSLTDHLGRSPKSPIVNAICPGFCYSELRRGMNVGYSRAAISMRMTERMFAWPAEYGGRLIAIAAVGGVGNEDQMRGSFMASGQLTEAGDNVISAEGKWMREEIWREVIDILSKVDPRVKSIAETILTGSNYV